MQSACNEGKTHDGIAALALNLLHEFLHCLKTEHVVLSEQYKLKLSVVGHSLGGLIGRYMIKLLFDLDNDQSEVSLHDDLKELRSYYLENISPFLIPCVGILWN